MLTTRHSFEIFSFSVNHGNLRRQDKRECKPVSRIRLFFDHSIILSFLKAYSGFGGTVVKPDHEQNRCKDGGNWGRGFSFKQLFFSLVHVIYMLKLTCTCCFLDTMYICTQQTNQHVPKCTTSEIICDLYVKLDQWEEFMSSFQKRDANYIARINFPQG